MNEYQTKNKSIADGFFNTSEKYAEMPILRYKNKDGNKITFTYKEASKKVTTLAKAFSLHGVKEKTHVAIFSENRMEWFLSDMALLALGAIDVPRGNDSTVDELKYIVEHSESSAIIVENEMMYQKIKDMSKKLDFILVLDNSLHDPKNKIYSFDSFMEEGSKALNGDESFAKKCAKKINRDNTATIIYTSGTTGRPKGVVLTHQNILHNVECLPPLIGLKQGEKFLTILPIWHIYERTISYVISLNAAFLVFTNKRDFKNDLAEEKPDMFISVPSIWVNIHKSVMKSISQKNFIIKNLVTLFINRSIAYTRKKRYDNNMVYLLGTDKKENHIKNYKSSPFDAFCHKMAKKLVYKNLINITGGKMRLTISGGGSLPTYIEDFLEACEINLIVGWGITETAPVISLRQFKNNFKGTCGLPVTHVDIEVRNSNGEKCKDGEFGLCWAKGPNIFKEYYKDPELTKKALVNGYFDTGDLGVYTQQGEIVLSGRAKETIVLLTGENVEPQPIENKILQSSYIEHVMLVGQDKAMLGALVVLEKDVVAEYCHKHKIDIKNKKMSEIKEVMALVRKSISSLVNSKSGFRPFECISKIYIMENSFTIENEMLTQSLKMKRNEIFNEYKDEIESMYSN